MTLILDHALIAKQTSVALSNDLEKLGEGCFCTILFEVLRIYFPEFRKPARTRGVTTFLWVAKISKVTILDAGFRQELR